jgi:single-strand DNA-binding protein
MNMSWNNKVELVGSLGADPETRFTQGGTMVLSFRVATTERWKDASGAQKEETEWHSCVCFGKPAEDAAPHLRKGSYVRIEGKLKTESYEKDGQKRYTTKIHINHVAPAAFPKSRDAAPTPANNTIPFVAPVYPPSAGVDVDNLY